MEFLHGVGRLGIGKALFGRISGGFLVDFPRIFGCQEFLSLRTEPSQLTGGIESSQRIIWRPTTHALAHTNAPITCGSLHLEPTLTRPTAATVTRSLSGYHVPVSLSQFVVSPHHRRVTVVHP